MKTEYILDVIKSDEDIDNVLKDLKEFDFVDYVNQILDAKHLKKKDVIEASGLSQKYVYRVLDGTNKEASKERLLCLAIAMQLTLDETNHFLSLQNAGDLYAKNPREAIIMRGIHKKKSLMEINDDLYDHGFEILDAKSYED